MFAIARAHGVMVGARRLEGPKFRLKVRLPLAEMLKCHRRPLLVLDLGRRLRTVARRTVLPFRRSGACRFRTLELLMKQQRIAKIILTARPASPLN